jgi:hypothetical protein
MYQQNTLQMEWCLNCHRNPSVNLRPTSEIYNMAWAGPSKDKPVWCADTKNTAGTEIPTAQGVSCTTKDPKAENPEVAMLQLVSATPRGQERSNAGTNMSPHPTSGEGQTASDVPPAGMPLPKLNYTQFTSQHDLGMYLNGKYHIRTANELSSCEVCHR